MYSIHNESHAVLVSCFSFDFLHMVRIDQVACMHSNNIYLTKSAYAVQFRGNVNIEN